LPVAIALGTAVRNAASASAARSAGALTTTSTVVPSCGKAAVRRSYASTTAKLRGSASTPSSDVRIVSVGRARPATRAPAASVQTRGRRTTAPASRPQAPSTLPRRAARRLENGSRTASTLSPSTARSAGSTVAEARTATATTSIAPIASEVNRPPATSMPLMATMTVTPEMTTARPAVAPARPIDSVTVAPAARSSRARRSTNST
jgi:hypothetical protein